MTRLPWIKFYSQDWLGDTRVGLCSAVGRGVWHEMLALMWHDGTYQVVGTIDELARLLRMTPTDVETGLHEIGANGVAEVSKCNGTVTVLSRRLQRESKQREQGLKRIHKHRGHAPVTPPVTKHVTGSVTGYVTGRALEPQSPRVLEAQKHPVEAPASTGGPKRSGDHAEVIEHFCKTFEAKTGHRYPFDGGKDGKIVAGLLKLYGLAKLKEIVDKFFGETDTFWSSKGYSIGLLKVRVPSLLSAKENLFADDMDISVLQKLEQEQKQKAEG